jgi:hypothetical protein
MGGLLNRKNLSGEAWIADTIPMRGIHGHHHRVIPIGSVGVDLTGDVYLCGYNAMGKRK